METTIAKGINVLNALVQSPAPLRLATVAQQAALPKSGAHRLLGTWMELGFVQQDPSTGYYSPTLKLWELGQAVIGIHPTKRAAAPYMQELHKLTAETVNLLVRDDIEVLYIDKILAERPLRFSTQPGSRALAALTGAGKAMLAYETRDTIVDVVERTLAVGDARSTDLELDAFLLELDDIRKTSIAKSDGSWTMGIMSYASPIFGQDGKAAAAMSVTAPRERVTADKEAQIIESLLYVCARIAETFGRL